jgi:hypothetical protein
LGPITDFYVHTQDKIILSNITKSSPNMETMQKSPSADLLPGFTGNWKDVSPKKVTYFYTYYTTHTHTHTHTHTQEWS